MVPGLVVMDIKGITGESTIMVVFWAYYCVSQQAHIVADHGAMNGISVYRG